MIKYEPSLALYEMITRVLGKICIRFEALKEIYIRKSYFPLKLGLLGLHCVRAELGILSSHM